MIDFHKLKFSQKEEYERYLMEEGTRGCEYSFANQVLWGRQQAAFLHGCVLLFAHFYGRSVYPYPIGGGDKKAAVEAILADARKRGIPIRFTGLLPEDCEELERWFPEMFYFRKDRDSFDYVYAIDDLADLAGRKFQKKRNHYNRFRTAHPDYVLEPLTRENMAQAQALVKEWYDRREAADPRGDYMLEHIAMNKAFCRYQELGMEGLLLLVDGEAVAMTMGSRLSGDTFDIHFEKAREDVEGAYAAINCEFAKYLREKYPEVAYLNREDDLGLEGLRKAKLSYNPHHMVEKAWAYLREEIHED